MSEEKEMKYRGIVQNMFQTGKVFGIDWRNIIEATISSLIVLIIIASINFVSEVKIIASLVLGVSIFYINIVGLKGRSLSQVFISEIKFHKSKRHLHLTTPSHTRKISNWKTINTLEGASHAEKFKFFLTRAYRRYLGRED